MIPIALASAEDAAQFWEGYRKAILLFWATIAVVALTLVVLAAGSAEWSRMIEWCRMELTPFSCSLYIAGI